MSCLNMCSVKDVIIIAFLVGAGILIELRITQFEQLYNDVISIQKTVEEIRQTLTRKQESDSHASCKDYFDDGYKKNDIYSISPDGKTKFDAYCDMNNGGWTVIQRRINGAVDFDRGWYEYANGFGDLMADHWLGLHYIHLLTHSPKQISFEFLITNTKQIGTAVYDGFQVQDISTNFKMHVSPKVQYNGEMSKYISAHNGFYYQNGMKFSTKDRDNDMLGNGKCTDQYGPWWHNKCVQIGCLNWKFNHMRIWRNDHYYISTSEVKIR